MHRHTTRRFAIADQRAAAAGALVRVLHGCWLITCELEWAREEGELIQFHFQFSVLMSSVSFITINKSNCYDRHYGKSTIHLCSK